MAICEPLKANASIDRNAFPLIKLRIMYSQHNKEKQNVRLEWSFCIYVPRMGLDLQIVNAETDTVGGNDL